MKWSWKGIILAPLLIPFLASAALTIPSPGPHPLWGFLFFFAVGSLISYCATLFLLLPSLFMISRFTQLTILITALTGTILGAVADLPISWVEYNSSGVDSGPPSGTFFEFLQRDFFGQQLCFFLVAGLVTALLYWFLSRPSSRKSEQPTV